MPKITDAYLKSLKAHDKPELVLVDTGLYLRITKSHNGSAAKKWLLRFRHGGKSVKFVFGSFPEIGLAEARVKALELLSRARKGENLAEAKEREAGKRHSGRLRRNGWRQGHGRNPIAFARSSASRTRLSAFSAASPLSIYP